jgi:hypothetical protein
MSAMSRRSLLAAGGAVLTSFLAGCAPARSRGGEAGIGDPPGPGQSGVDPAILEAWRDFPVTRTPRPILLLGAPLRETGYHTGDAKLAVATGRYKLATTLPSTQPATSTATLPDGTFPLPIITAAQAYESLRGSGNPANAPDANPAPLLITRVELGMVPFPTDRGALDLPAWLFHAPESFEPLAWPAPHPDAFWHLGDLTFAGDTSDGRLAADTITLTVSMPAPNPGACPGDPIYRHHPVVLEESTAVAVGVRREIVSIAPGPRRDDCGYDLMLRVQPYTVTLAAPLGKRVLVSNSGEPVAVTVGR